MLITAIEQTKKGRFSIFADGEYFCALHPDIFMASRIKTGISMEEEELVELRARSELKITKDRALRLLSARAYTSSKLMGKLMEYSDEETARSVVDRMTELGLVNDLDYARRYAAECMERKGFSLMRTKLALREKGIPRDIIDEALSDLEEEPEPAIARVILRKFMTRLDSEKGLQKTTNALLRLGYRHGDIRRAIANLLEDPCYYDDWE